MATPGDAVVTRRPMNIIEKILFHHAVGLDERTRSSGLSPGMCVCVKVDWVMANELTLVGISDMWKKYGKPKVFDKKRVWLAVDHTVDPRNYSQPKPTALINLADSFARETEIDDYLPPNQSIMHTEFARQRAQPGQIVIGADSHTCSAGGMGAYACGLGAADVSLPLVTGHTWFNVPETILVEFVGAPPFGVSGKDVILHTLGALKRNTVALDRACVYAGSGLAYLSSDARFAVANMTTEFGGIVGVFEADAVTARTLAGRTAHKDEGLYFRADVGAQYAGHFTIDLSLIKHEIALFPSPDNCKPVTELIGMRLDGCFIGACTTTQEELILAAMVIEKRLEDGDAVVPRGNRRVTPGSREIVKYLEDNGLLEVYKRAGFTVGVPGCSYCLGIAADVAGEGEIWLSSQNRNFANRMGKGSIANLAAAAVVAVSAFDMSVTDPAPYLARIDRERYDRLRQFVPSPASCHGDAAAAPVPATFTVTEPVPRVDEPAAAAEEGQAATGAEEGTWDHLPTAVHGRAQVFGDGVDTDAIIPAQFMGCSPADMVKYGGTADMTEDAFLGMKAFAYVRPEFVPRVAAGATVVVAGNGFGCGSSREEAVRALVGAGVKAVIARSFAFIYARNQPNFSLLGCVVKDDAFYAAAVEGAEVTVDVAARTVSVAGATYPFTLSRMEERFLRGGGVERLFRAFRKELFKAVLADDGAAAAAGPSGACGTGDCGTSSVLPAGGESKLAW